MKHFRGKRSTVLHIDNSLNFLLKTEKKIFDNEGKFWNFIPLEFFFTGFILKPMCKKMHVTECLILKTRMFNCSSLDFFFR